MGLHLSDFIQLVNACARVCTDYHLAFTRRMMWAAGILASISSISYPAISAFVSTHADADKQGLVQVSDAPLRQLSNLQSLWKFMSPRDLNFFCSKVAGKKSNELDFIIASFFFYLGHDHGRARTVQRTRSGPLRPDLLPLPRRS